MKINKILITFFTFLIIHSSQEREIRVGAGVKGIASPFIWQGMYVSEEKLYKDVKAKILEDNKTIIKEIRFRIDMSDIDSRIVKNATHFRPLALSLTLEDIQYSDNYINSKFINLYIKNEIQISVPIHAFYDKKKEFILIDTLEKILQQHKINEKIHYYFANPIGEGLQQSYNVNNNENRIVWIDSDNYSYEFYNKPDGKIARKVADTYCFATHKESNNNKTLKIGLAALFAVVIIGGGYVKWKLKESPISYILKLFK